MDESCDESVSFRNVSVLYVYVYHCHYYCVIVRIFKNILYQSISRSMCSYIVYSLHYNHCIISLLPPFLIFNVMELKNEEKTTSPTWCILPPKHLIQGKVVHFVVNYLYYIPTTHTVFILHLLQVDRNRFSF